MTRKKLQNMAAIIIAVLILLSILTISGGGLAYAATNTSSDIMSDLSKDEHFNSADYPAKANDYGLYIMQIAESTDGKLLLYVYQPSGTSYKLKATTARIAREPVKPKKWTDYDLTLLNYSGVFYKYQVDGLKVNGDSIRYYDIAAIHRKYYKSIDKEPPTGQTVNEVAYEVGQLWGAQNVDGETEYKMRTSETVTITDKHVGFVRYPEGMSWLKYGACDRHFVAFSTDREIDNLIEADVTFITRDYTYTPVSGKTYKEYSEPIFKPLKYSDIASTSPDLFAHTYTWERIESTERFLNEAGLSDEEDIKKIKSKQWVLSFTETPYTVDGTGVVIGSIIGGLVIPGIGVTIGGTLAAMTYDAVEVSEVSILRLKFETAGKCYDLGVVDNKQTGSLTPSNGAQPWKWWQWALLIIGIVFIVVIALIVLSVLFPRFGMILNIVLSAVWKGVKAPFVFIGGLAKKCRERIERRKAERERKRAERKVPKKKKRKKKGAKK